MRPWSWFRMPEVAAAAPMPSTKMPVVRSMRYPDVAVRLGYSERSVNRVQPARGERLAQGRCRTRCRRGRAGALAGGDPRIWEAACRRWALHRALGRSRAEPRRLQVYVDRGEAAQPRFVTVFTSRAAPWHPRDPRAPS